MRGPSVAIQIALAASVRTTTDTIFSIASMTKPTLATVPADRAPDEAAPVEASDTGQHLASYRKRTGSRAKKRA